MKQSNYKISEDQNLKHGDKYIIGDSHVKTFHALDLDCYEDRTNGAIKVEIIK